MSFASAIRSGFANYVTFRGRASRSEYWWWALFTVIVQLVASAIHENVGNATSIALFLPSIAVGVRRMHDTNHRGWWMLVPIVNLVFSLKKSDPTENRFGPPPPPRA
jgi:uncharacterized membrane protein YhaH (DUF805 family)